MMKTAKVKSNAPRKTRAAAHSIAQKRSGQKGTMRFADDWTGPAADRRRFASNSSTDLSTFMRFDPTPLLSNRTAPLQTKTVIQRTTLQEVYDDIKDNLNLLGTFSSWIQDRAGDDLNDWQYLLSRMTLEEVKKTLELYGERIEGENIRNTRTLEDIIESGGLVEQMPGKQIDELMLSSPHIGDIIAKKQSQNISVKDQVVALDDAEFAERHWQEFLWENRHINFNEQQKQTLKLREAARVDRVDGFQANSDGKIYMRPTKMGLRVAIHEGVHKYGGVAFEAYLGHVLNEGATDYIAMLVCAQVGAEIAPQYYPLEKKLLLQVLKVLKITDEELFAAYFNDKLTGILDKLVDRIGPEYAITFRKAKTYNDAVQAFNDGQKAMQEK